MDTLSKHIAAIREDYIMNTLDEKDAGVDPVSFFEKWFSEAENAEISEVNAMTLATVDSNGFPHARIVLLKGIENGSFVFYTNYNSAKGHDMSANNKVAAVFFWKELQRQVRIEGLVSKIDPLISDEYFASRPYGSQIGAIASPQSSPIESRTFLEKEIATLKLQYPENTKVPRPAHWGGYVIIPHRIEFWQGRASRLHDRVIFKRDASGNWGKQRLAP